MQRESKYLPAAVLTGGVGKWEAFYVSHFPYLYLLKGLSIQCSVESP